MQVHRTTGTTPFDLVLTRHPPNIVMSDRPSATPPTIPDTELSTAQLKRHILRRLRQSLAQAQVRTTEAQKRYKADFDQKVQRTLTVKAGDYVFVDRAPGTVEEDDEDAYAQRTKKLLPRSTGPYLVKSTTEDTVTIEQDGLQNVVSIDRVSMAPSGPVTRPRVRDVTADPEGPHTDTAEDDNNVAEPDSVEYAIDRIVTHRPDKDGMYYRVRWYGYGPEEDTWEPEHHIPANFVTRYWNRRTQSQ